MISGHGREEWDRMVPARRRFLAQQEAARLEAQLAHARSEVVRLEQAHQQAWALVASLEVDAAAPGAKVAT